MRMTRTGTTAASATITDPSPAGADPAPQAGVARRAELELRALLDAAVDAVIVIDHEGRIETFNPAAERLFGYSAAEIGGRNVCMLMPDPQRAEHEGYLRAYLTTGRAHIIGIGREVVALRRDGSVFPVSLSVGQIAGFRPPRFVGLIHDISDRKRAEEEMRQSHEKLMHVARLSTMGEMATSLAHEINQPLTAIATYAQATLRMLDSPAGADEAELRDTLAQITAQALRAGEVIRRLRGLAMNRAAHTEALDLNRLIEDLRVLAEPDARLNDVRLTLELAPTVAPVAADPIQIQQVLLNLVRNAIDATLERPDALREIVVRTYNHPDAVEVAVIDHGAGVPAAIADELFNPFFTTKPAGTGLGLAISRSIIRAHRGKLGYRPTPGGGTTFMFTLPPLPGG